MKILFIILIVLIPVSHVAAIFFNFKRKEDKFKKSLKAVDEDFERMVSEHREVLIECLMSWGIDAESLTIEDLEKAYREIKKGQE